MSYKHLGLIICLLIGVSTPLNLVPDVNNPLSIKFPSTSENGAIISVRFYFPSATPNALGPLILASSGLSYKQFIGVSFPSIKGTLLTSSSQFGCALSDNSGNTYAMESKLPSASATGQGASAETNMAFCQLTELTNVPLKVD